MADNNYGFQHEQLLCETAEVANLKKQKGVKNLHHNSKVKTFLQSADILAAPQNFDWLFEGQNMVSRSILELGLGQDKGVGLGNLQKSSNK